MMINKIEVANPLLYQRYAEWLAKQLTGGAFLAKYSCPHCASTLFTATPPVDEVADTFATCPVCDKLYFKVVDFNGSEPVVTTEAVTGAKTA